MMATTEPENIPQTIRSRCQHFSFHAVRFDDILEQLRKIAREEQVEAEDTALALLAEAGDGSMRDALSIMDQATASAPVQDGRHVLAAGQIRDLMGSVPQTVFERLMEAAAQGESIALMEQLNVLLHAGHSPSSLARQLAKLGGEQTELLQISGDERARAARTAMLFTEEELTRNLQIMLRTFDDLNFRQEQRFHLELGLMKLVHAQRLLPLEELLSALGGKSLANQPQANPSQASAQRSPAGSTRSASTPPVTPPPAAPNLSPFGPSGGSWGPGRTMESSAKPLGSGSNVTEMPRPVSAPASDTPVAGSVTKAEPAVASTQAGFTASLTEGSLAKAPEDAPAGGAVDPETMRQAVVTALEQGGHSSASQLLGAALWSVEGATVRIETAPMGKKMLSLTVNAASEKIIRQELQRLGAPSRFLVVPGAGAAVAGSTVAATPTAGSVQEAALANPMVQKAKEIFKAEVRSVVDLRSK
jgi:DNA polymerase-3 subunit gamma/tau